MANYIDQKKKNLLQNQESQETPATVAYQRGADGERADELLQQINNREKFSYDMEQDPLYQQYKKQAIQYGQRAMQDTMGQAAALTGGYGSSYSQSAGQQAYQNYLQKLNEQVPQLYQLALNQYNQQGQDLKDQYALYADREAQNYGRYLDSLAQQQWNQQFAYQQDRDTVADQQWQQQFDADRAYQQWQQQFSQQQFDTQNRQWQQQFDADQAYQQWQQQFSQQQFDTQNQQWQKEFDLATQKASGGSSSGSVGGSDTRSIQQMLRNAGFDISVDGSWGPETQAAYNAYMSGQKSGLKGGSGAAAFNNSVMSQEDWKRRTGSTAGYKENIANQLVSWVSEGRITMDEYDVLAQKYKVKDIINKMAGY